MPPCGCPLRPLLICEKLWTKPSRHQRQQSGTVAGVRPVGGGVLAQPHGRKLDHERDRRAVDVDAVGVEPAPETDARTDNCDLGLVHVPGRPARGLQPGNPRPLLQRHHQLDEARTGVEVTRFPEVRDRSRLAAAERVDELDHPADVVVVGMGGDDKRERPGSVRVGEQVAAAQGVEEGGHVRKGPDRVRGEPAAGQGRRQPGPQRLGHPTSHDHSGTSGTWSG
jgi:hypothetical protein